MRTIALMLVLLGVAGCGAPEPTGDPRPSVESIRERSKFRPHSASTLAPEERGAIEATRRYLAQHYGHPIEGEFAIAQTKRGYQVNFHSLKAPRPVGGQPFIEEGFGEAWIENGEVIRADIGP
jgi:hypothetical protein